MIVTSVILPCASRGDGVSLSRRRLRIVYSSCSIADSNRFAVVLRAFVGDGGRGGNVESSSGRRSFVAEERPMPGTLNGNWYVTFAVIRESDFSGGPSISTFTLRLA